ncbi:hypothetical protein [Pseudoalteromonas rubra]|uniref:Amino acid ABC transporter substrate-binding protein n=1 Tax=Pseudoalteromonas rubra TaxID=43658 RepID=A0A5S3WY13_9GAMM|nr:hypothetical protein [Pseudoalteromonas rubra]TMP36477.1 hypothetical protein CWB98_12650 [Pseudoalteromonas rubra]
MHTIYSLFGLLLWLMPISGHAAATPLPPAGAELPVLRVALPYNAFPPFVTGDPNRPGVIPELLAHFAPEGKPLDVDYIPEERSKKLINYNQIQVRMESESWYRGKTPMCWSQGLYWVEDVLITHQSAKAPTQDYQDSIMLGRFGYTYPTVEQALALGQLQQKLFYSEREMLDALASPVKEDRRFALMSLPAIRWLQLSNPKFITSLKVHKVVDTAPLQLQFNHSEQGLRGCAQFRDFFVRFRHSTEYRSILLKYGLDIKGVPQ